MVMPGQLATIASLAANNEVVVGEITLVRLETLTVTLRLTYNAASAVATRLNLYFSPDADNYDTVPFAYFDVDLTAGAICQKTKVVDAPEAGYLRFAVQNRDVAQAVTNISAWSSLVRE